MTSYINQISSLGPKIWYRFNETSGTPVNFGSLSTTSTFTDLLLNEQSEVDGRAVYLNGSSSRIQLPAHPAFSLFNDRSFTVECWVKLSTTDTNSTGPFEIFRLNPASSPHNTISLTVGGTSGNRGKVILSSPWITTQISTNAIDNDTWHHIVYTHNTSSVKLYINGILDKSTTPTNLPSSFVYDESTKKLIGAGYVGTAQTTISQYLRGRIDEFAAYDYELTSQNILDNYNAGASVTFADTAGTASALSVMPTWTTEAINTVDPMTANATADGHAASTIDLPKLLNTYMGELTLETWFKFDVNRYLENYGTGGTGGANWTGTPINDVAGGIQGTGSISLNGTDMVLQIGTQMSSVLQDEDFTIGFWVKKLTKEATTGFFTSLLSTGNDLVKFFWNADGGITFRINGGNQDHDVASSTDITDGEWHFIVGRLASSTMELFIDNVSIGTTTMNQSLTLNTTRFEGGGSTDDISLSQFFISTSANVGSTQIGNIYDYGTPTSTQASAYMPPAAAKFNSAFNDYVQSKSPLFDFRMDETTGIPTNFGSANITLSSELNPQGYVQGETGLNNRSFKFTDRAQGLRGNYNLSSGTLSSANTATIGVLFKTNWKTLGHTHIGLGGTVSGSNGIYLNTLNTGVLRVFSGNANGTTTNLTGTTDFADNKWHLAVVVQETSTLKLYVDGKLEASTSRSTAFTDAGQFSIALPPGLTQAANNTLVKYIDEAFATNTAWTAQEVFEAYQALRLEMDTTATASLPMPAADLGTGNIYTASPATASGELVDPGQDDTINILATPLTASSEFILPNYGGNIVIDANYGHTAATASALLHDPQANIGENHIAASLDASALMVHPATIAGGAITVSTAVAGPADLVMPGIVTIKGAKIFAAPMDSRAFMPIPPAYFTLQDDRWYLRLFAQHAVPNIEDAFITASTTTAATQTAKTFLKFFNTETVSIGSGSAEKLENNLTIYDANDVSPSTAASLSPTPLLSPGYFDEQGRKAVRIENIEFEIEEEIYNSRKPYSLEFSVRTTKANQIIAKGKWRSYTGNQRAESAVGLFNGKLYVMETNTTTGTIGDRTPHPSNPDVGGATKAIVGNKNIADGQWHHIIVQQGYEDNRIQIWVDGQLDRQVIGVTYARPYTIGYNSSNANYRAEFDTSAWSYDKQEFLLSHDVALNYIGYLQYDPVKAAPMLATAASGNHKAQGNRGRALLLYWWPVTGLGDVNNTDRFQFGYFDEPTFDKEVLTVDYKEQPPQQWYGWDLYPIDITGRYVSDFVKTESYGGVQNIRDNVTNPGAQQPLTIKENIRGYFRDPITDARRYIDLTNDIDLSNFDAIFFRNYPDQSLELDAYTREEFADSYFNVKEREIYEDFVASVRGAVDKGLSLFISNAQLAIDLGIVDRVEEVSDMYDVENETDPYAPTQLPAETLVYLNNGVFLDTWRNNKFRVVNIIPELTGDASYILSDTAYFKNDDALDYGGPNRPFYAYDYRPNGLQVGDTFIYANYHPQYSVMYQATPIANIKSGIAITAFANTVRKGTLEIDNPYKDYATSIAVRPGDFLKGTAVKGKIFVNFTERLSGETFGFIPRKINSAAEIGYVDLVTDYWINKAFEAGEITETKKNELIASPDNLDRKLANNQITQSEYNILTRWDSNGQYIVSQRNILDEDVSAAANKNKALKVKYNKSGIPTTSTTNYGGQLFTFKYSRQFPTLIIDVMSMLSRGIRWLSNATIDDGLVIRTQAMTASALAVHPDSISGDKDKTVYAQSMLANATIIPSPVYTPADVSNTTLPLTATAAFGEFVKNIKPDVFAASATMREARTSGIQEDEIVVYMIHVDPILYLREEVIK